MKKDKGQLIFSPSDLTSFMASPFASWVERFNVENKEHKYLKTEDPVLTLLQDRGNTHELEYLEVFKDRLGEKNVKCLETDKYNNQKNFENTLEAIKGGPKVIFQAYLRRDNFHGFADFLIRVDYASAPNGYYYEAWDTKLSKKVKPYFLVQLCAYSWMLEEMQGVLPKNTTVVLGDQQNSEFLVGQYYDYFLTLKSQFLTFQSDYKNDVSACPDPALFSEYGNWTDVAQTMLQESDSLALVANMRKTQIKRLRTKSINTLTELANSKLDYVSGINTEVFRKLKAQASLQLASRQNSKAEGEKKYKIEFDIIHDDQGKGLSALPKPNASDVFFDIEGNPFNDGGLEYLWGASFIQDGEPKGKKYQFKDWWGHTPDLEKAAFINFVKWVHNRWLESDKKMHIYHYASYEVTAIKKLSERHQVLQKEVAELLASGALVDLYKIVRNGMIIGESKYSIKNVEKLYRLKRNTQDDVSSGGESIVEYEKWLELGGLDKWSTENTIFWPSNAAGVDWQDPCWKKIKAIRDYNIDDCESTLELVEFLRGIKSTGFVNIAIPTAIKEDSEDERYKKAELNEFRQNQINIINRLKDYLVQEPNNLVAKGLMDVLQFHYREYKASVFETYLLKDKSSVELFDEGKALVASEFVSEEFFTDNRGIQKVKLTFAFDSEQSLRTDVLSGVTEFLTGLALSSGNFSASEHGSETLDRVTYTSKVSEWQQVKEQVARPQAVFIFRPESIFTKNLEKRLCEHALSFLNNPTQNKLLTTIIKQQAPTFFTGENMLPVSKDDKNRPLLDEVFKAVSQMNASCFSIQGPPGTGKTFTASYVIRRLLADKPDCRIGVTSNSNKAIINLFTKVLSDTKGQYKTAFLGKKNYQNLVETSVDQRFMNTCCLREDFRFPKSAKDGKGKQLNEMRVFASTCFKFANNLFSQAENQLDYLFVDEAGQFSLANLLAITGAAKNIVLLGDQMQLEQTVQAAHPGIAGISALQHVLNNERVVPDNKGVFLGCSYRMHSDVCKPLSSAVYQDELYSDQMNEKQRIIWAEEQGNERINQEKGVQFIGVAHQGNSLESYEELAVVEQLIKLLLASHYIDKHDTQNSSGGAKKITEKDILIVAPYNQQVNLLKEKLNKKDKYPDLQIGTVDKFQGQEAQVVIYSMTASNLSDSSRGIGFLLSINRLNVAISRAKTLAIIVSSEQLIDVSPKTIEQVRQLNLYCALRGHKQEVSDIEYASSEKLNNEKQLLERHLSTETNHREIDNNLMKSTSIHNGEAMTDKDNSEKKEFIENFEDETFNSALSHVKQDYRALFVELLVWLEKHKFYQKLDWGVANHSYLGAGPSTIGFGKANEPASKTGKRSIRNAILRLVAYPGSEYGYTLSKGDTRFKIDGGDRGDNRPPILVIRASLLDYLRTKSVLNNDNLPDGFHWVFRIGNNLSESSEDRYALIAPINEEEALKKVQIFLDKISELIMKEVA